MTCVLLFGGCFARVEMPARGRLECPVPFVPCAPGSTNEVTIDTSSAVGGPGGHYLTISRVDGLNTPIDEFSVVFQSPMKRGTGEALATIRRKPVRQGGEDQLALVTFTRVDKGNLDGAIEVLGVDGAVGGGSQRSDAPEIHIAASASGNVAGDYDLYQGVFSNDAIKSARRNGLSVILPWDAQPALTPDGTRLYFASDRKGSIGGVDLWMSSRQSDGGWGEPVNLGVAVNTPCDELSPWVSGDGKWLYFSSAGHATVGGYDLFRSAVLGASGHARAQNLGRPVNTTSDEIFPSAPPNVDPDTLLYYSSNQPGAKFFDIHLLHRLPRVGGGGRRRDPREVTLTGTVIGPDGRPVDSALVRIEGGDPPIKDSTRTDPDGRYRLPVREGETYELIAGSDSSLYMREIVRIPYSDGRTTVTRDVQLPDTVTFRVNFPFNNATDPYEYTLDDQGLPSDVRWTDMIDRAAEFLSQQNATRSRYEIIGHTDPVGTDPFNVDLGRRRAEFIKRELVRRGVSSAILTTRSEGETSPLVRRQSEAEDLYHARLRRVTLVRKP